MPRIIAFCRLWHFARPLEAGRPNGATIDVFAVPEGGTVVDGLWLILALVAVVIVYVIAKVRYYMKQSEEQWRQVDKSKLREWEDDD